MGGIGILPNYQLTGREGRQPNIKLEKSIILIHGNRVTIPKGVIDEITKDRPGEKLLGFRFAYDSKTVLLKPILINFN